MIKLIDSLPDAVVGLEAIGEVDSADYKMTATPEVRQALERHRKIRLIHVLDDRFTGYTAGGAWQDALLGLAHPRSFERIAVVTVGAPAITETCQHRGRGTESRSSGPSRSPV